jgi:hypothetical protein
MVWADTNYLGQLAINLAVGYLEIVKRGNTILSDWAYYLKCIEEVPFPFVD